MSEDSQNLEKAVAQLKKEVKNYDNHLAISGWLLIIALVAIPCSIAIGNKMLGGIAVSWIASSFVSIGSAITMRKRDEITSLLEKYELSERMKKASVQAADKEAANVSEAPFGPIGLN